MFADDKTLYSSHQCPTAAAAVASTGLNAISSSLAPKGLSINEVKTVAMVIQPPRSVQDTAPVILNGKPLQMVSETHCLGVIIDDRLSWSSHVNSVASKAGRKIGVLRQVRRRMSERARRLYLLSVVQPDLEYCAIAFLSSCRNRLLAIFRRALRAVVGAPPQAECLPIMRELNVQPLVTRCLVQLGSFVFECSKQPPAQCLANMLSLSRTC